MALEIERKFLVTSQDYKTEAFSENRIVQGFLNTHPERTVRVRITGNKGFLTVKGKSNEEGTTRFEWEQEIDLPDAESLLQLCEEGVIEKTRYEVNVGAHIFEVDEFFGTNEGLCIAEIELSESDELFERPNWLGQEVTGEIKYYNACLSKTPYATW